MNHLDAIDPDTVIWRYLTFAKFSKLVSLRALWFAKLGIFQDIEEGTTPHIARQKLKALRIPTQSGRGFRFEVGHRSDLIPATIPI
jgi:hypothetical protein